MLIRLPGLLPGYCPGVYKKSSPLPIIQAEATKQQLVFQLLADGKCNDRLLGLGLALMLNSQGES